MQVEKPPVDKVWTVSTPLWPDKHTMSGLCLAPESSYPRKILKEDSAWSCRHHNSWP